MLTWYSWYFKYVALLMFVVQGKPWKPSAEWIILTKFTVKRRLDYKNMNSTTVTWVSTSHICSKLTYATRLVVCTHKKHSSWWKSSISLHFMNQRMLKIFFSSQYTYHTNHPIQSHSAVAHTVSSSQVNLFHLNTSSSGPVFARDVQAECGGVVTSVYNYGHRNFWARATGLTATLRFSPLARV